ncbi:heme o synthase [Bacillus atrophaeus]|uniref:Protoheme IX farnesyltransferase n=1 Tax=Bacillus atrophaeus (strain 1942) TaxID=720555 RepID=A0ABN3ZA97_BACA1|nr:heme o synthase [Bacillus atrophaeus]AMR63476.1 protoheme IX farnesyltransferase [Bacillus subtilis subsp. globigii]ADP31562.1 protoheme IX farnesyltransferase (heme O synthase) [Bacillus atrophaeus 1942]AIK47781.1 protoheme IX farnesyltransferase [Bacillus atrophaeus subsp. globigii]EIM10165.1 protoheme IX farnesyltransferase (heme O synthase) [Bacillus atrophaeus C89]KFK84301.1 protoheme IX farnesyltransferase [Bacillus atrophaeus]
MDKPEAVFGFEQNRVTIKDYIKLVKPGIIISNSIAAFGGFWIAYVSSEKALTGSAFFVTMLAAMIGTAFVMASGTVYNNYFDRKIDAKMARTRHRASVTGKMSAASIITFGTFLGIAGLGMLAALNVLTAVLGFLAFIFYAVIYTIWFKRTSVWSTVVGSFPGAAPPLMGYCAVAGHIDMTAVVLYAIMFLWQPPHFWAIGIRRKEEYRAAGVPLLPVVKGNHVTKISIHRYITVLVPVTLLLSFYVGLHHLSPLYFISALILGFIWIYKSYQGFKTDDDVQWSKGMFIYSLFYFCILFFIMMIDSFVMAFFVQ